MSLRREGRSKSERVEVVKVETGRRKGGGVKREKGRRQRKRVKNVKVEAGRREGVKESRM